MATKVGIYPVTSSRWGDLESLFGSRGACAGCWCMFFRRSRAEFERSKGAGNKKSLQRIVASGEVPGLLAYVGREPAG